MHKNKLICLVTILWLATGLAGKADAQTPPPSPPPLWELAVGGSFVGTSGNTDTSTVGADLALQRRWSVWRMEAAAVAISTSDQGDQTAERYLAAIRAKRQLTPLLGLSIGERVERDRFSGVDLRSILDGGLTWALVRQPRWTLDGLSSIAWNHEEPVTGPAINHPIGVFQALNKFLLGPGADTTQRFTVLPDFEDSSAYRAEAEITAQAAMNSRLALKFGYLWRYSNLPVPNFVKSDNTTTASIVLRWRATTPAP